MKTINQTLFDAAYTYACENWSRPFLVVNGDAITNPTIAKYANRNAQGFNLLVLNVSMKSCELFSLREGIFFKARFGGVVQECLIPWNACIQLHNQDDPSITFEYCGAIMLHQFLSATQTAPLGEPDNVPPPPPKSTAKLRVV